MRRLRSWQTGVAGGGDTEELANQYELLILNGQPVPANLDQSMRDAHRKVHLRGLDPLYKA